MKVVSASAFESSASRDAHLLKQVLQFVSSASSSTSRPVERGSVAVNIDAVSELPADLRLAAKRGDAHVRIHQ